ncbi:MAG: serine/threonine-protein kinase, partial [Planctomycetota bacterium]
MADDNTYDPSLTPTANPGDERALSKSVSPGALKRLGPYEITGEIGRGGMGVVLKGRHAQLKRTVALKVLIAGEDASAEAIQRFLREAEAVAKLGHHPNIVPVYDIGNEGNLHWFAMHFVSGKPLDRAIDDGHFAPEKAAAITQKLANALSHAHRNGILHRDIKPGNILLAPPEEPRARAGGEPTEGTEARDLEETPVPMLTDFGLAKDADSGSRMTRSGVMLGTPHYMAPE